MAGEVATCYEKIEGKIRFEIMMIEENAHFSQKSFPKKIPGVVLVPKSQKRDHLIFIFESTSDFSTRHSLTFPGSDSQS
jgi:hypothetical protein